MRVNPDELSLKDKVVFINRVAKVVKGGKRFNFCALVVVGDGQGATRSVAEELDHLEARRVREGLEQGRHIRLHHRLIVNR